MIFSGVDRTRNPDVEFRFSYRKGQMEPLKLNLSLSANIPVNDINSSDKYNQNLKYSDIKKLLKSCYWCIEWVYEYESGN